MRKFYRKTLTIYTPDSSIILNLGSTDGRKTRVPQMRKKQQQRRHSFVPEDPKTLMQELLHRFEWRHLQGMYRLEILLA